MTERETERVAEYQPRNEDGHRAVIYVTRYPAKFYAVHIPAHEQVITFGSGQADLAQRVAQRVAQGMLTVRDEDDWIHSDVLDEG